MVRASSLQALNTLSVNREIDSKYDVVLAVRDKLTEIESVAGIDVEALLTELQDAQDFTGITVVAGDHTSWDPINKTITVQSIKGDTGAQGIQGIQGPQGLSIIGPKGDQGPIGPKGDMGAQGPRGFTGDTGPVGPAGVDGENLTVEQISYNGDGSFTWQFSDGTSYITPNLRGPKGDTGSPGVKGDQGVSVHHIKGTGTTDSEGDFATFGEIDTYTVYGDAAETINLGYFRVNNGAAKEGQYSIMYASTYDTNANGIVDNSERLGGVLSSDVFNEIDSKFDKTGGLVSGDVTITGDLVVNGDTVTVNTETVTAKDNLILINSGEVGHGVTAGVAGIEVDRGLEDNYKFMFVESDESFKIGTDTTLQKVATREDTPLDTGIAVWDAADSRFEAKRNIDLDVLSFMGNGAISWNTDETTLDIALGTATLQVGQETLVKVRAGSAIGNGKVVMATGSLGNSGRVVVGLHDGTRVNGKRILGISTQNIANGTDGFVTAFGKVRNINTTGSDVGETWVDGDILYVKPGDSGNLTKVVPTDTQLSMPVAFVVHSHTNGTLFVRVTGIDENAVKDWMQAKLDAHTSRVDNPHSVTKAQVGLGNADNTADINKVVLSASKLTTGRVISTSGDATGSISFDGSSNVTIPLTLANVTDSGVGSFKKISVDTKGRITGTQNVVQTDITGLLGAGSITNTMIANSAVSSLSGVNTGDQTIILTGDATGSGTGSFLVTLSNSGVTAGTYRSVTVDSKGRVTTGSNPTTVSGYGLTDVYTKTEVDNKDTTLQNNIDTEKGRIDAILSASTADKDSFAEIVALINSVDTTNDTAFANYVLSNDAAVALKAPLASPTFTGNVTLPSTTSIGNVSVTEISYLDGVTGGIQGQLDAKAPIANPTFTGTVGGITKGMVGLGNVDNTSDVNKPVSTAQQAALNTKQDVLISGTNIKTIEGISLVGPGNIDLDKTNVGLSNVDNTSDLNKPISTATQTALDLKADKNSPTFTGTVILPSTTSIGNVSSVELGYLDGVTSGIQSQIDLKAPLASPVFTGNPTAPTASVGDNDTSIATTAFVNAEIANDAVLKTGATGAAQIPAGTTAERPVGVDGLIRYNSTTMGFEGYFNGQWQSVGGGQMLGNALVKGISYNAQVITDNVTVPAGVNAYSVGDTTIAAGASVTISAGSTYKIL